VAVDAEGTAVDELADAADGVRVPGEDLARQGAEPAVAAVHADAGQHAQDQHLRRRRRCRHGDGDGGRDGD